MTKKYEFFYVNSNASAQSYSKDCRKKYRATIEIDEGVEETWLRELIKIQSWRMEISSKLLDTELYYGYEKKQGFWTKPEVESSPGFYITDLSNDTLLNSVDSADSQGKPFQYDIRRALAHVMLKCKDNVKSLEFGGKRYEGIHDIKPEGLYVTFRATCSEEKGSDEKEGRKVKMAIPFPIYKISRYYYIAGENGTDKKYVIFDGEDFVEENKEDPPLFSFNVMADKGKIMILEKRDDDEGPDIVEYNACVEKAKELIEKKNRENDPSAKKYYIETFDSDSREQHSDITNDTLYELENDEGQQLTIVPPSDVFANGLGLSSNSYLQEGREIVDIFFGGALVGGKLKKGLFYYCKGELTEKYAYREAPDSEGAAYSMTEMKKSFDGKEICLKELPVPAKDAKIREKFNSLLEAPSADSAQSFSELFEEKVIRLEPFDDTDTEAIKRKLYQNDMVPNEEVIEKVLEQFVIYNGKKNEKAGGSESDKAPCVPNFAILGAPGTGKTTIARGLADVFGYDEDHFIIKSSSDLKGAYLGQTGARVFEMLKEADQKEAIIFIDEAYRLLDDNYGQEALAILLPVMSGDRKVIEKPRISSADDEGKNPPYKFEHGTPTIWFGGYEKELRAMLSKNPGLYRRMTILKMPEPTASQLYESLLRKSDNTLRQVFEREENEKPIKGYFGWGSSWEHAEYFGNYGGVERFLDSCRVYIKDPNETVRNRKAIEKVISDKKSEIKSQYRNVLSTQKDETGVFRFEVESDIETTFAEVKGSKNVVDNLREIVDMLCKQEEYSAKGIFVPKGMLMYGPPGTGKTLLARAMAGELQKRLHGNQKEDREGTQNDLRVAFIPTASTELITFADDPKRIKSLFAQAEEYDAAVIFIDEIDGIGRRRDSNGAHPTLLVQLMKEMDGFEERENIFVIAATNAPDALDPALMREGRFDRHVTVLPPDEDGRIAILTMYLDKLSVCEIHNRDVIKDLATKTVGFTPAKLKSTVNEAALLFKHYEESSEKPPYDREGDSGEDRFRKDLLEMVKRASMGERMGGEKESEFNTKENAGWSATAVHEVGHALMSRLLGRSISEITIIPRDMVSGHVLRNTVGNTKRQLRNEIMIDLGGLAAERLFYGDDYSAGASDDIKTATGLAYDMVAKYGMSDDIGPMALIYEGNGYLGEDGRFKCSDAFRERVDDAVRKLLGECLSTVQGMLSAHKDTIERIAREVFDKETMDAETFRKVCEANNILEPSASTPQKA